MKKGICISLCILAAVLVLLLVGGVFRGNGSSDEQYRMEEADGLYTCYFYGEDHALLRTETSPRCPQVEVLPGGYIRYTVQAGTGIGTRWGFYFDGGKGVFSDNFVGIADEKDGLAVCCGGSGITVRSIFDDSFCAAVTAFSHELSPAADPFLSAAFADEEGYLDVSYYSGADYSVVTERVSYRE